MIAAAHDLRIPVTIAAGYPEIAPESLEGLRLAHHLRAARRRYLDARLKEIVDKMSGNDLKGRPKDAFGVGKVLLTLFEILSEG